MISAHAMTWSNEFVQLSHASLTCLRRAIISVRSLTLCFGDALPGAWRQYRKVSHFLSRVFFAIYSWNIWNVKLKVLGTPACGPESVAFEVRNENTCCCGVGPENANICWF